jgi:ABC-type transporter Mla subunit MlaD
MDLSKKALTELVNQLVTAPAASESAADASPELRQAILELARQLERAAGRDTKLAATAQAVQVLVSENPPSDDAATGGGSARAAGTAD